MHEPAPDSQTLLEARGEYFRANGFGADGGYGDAWVDFKLGPVPFPFPNTHGRRRALAYHDLHHILTGYRTDFVGELEISAWEIGSGCGDFWAAWALDVSGLAGGAFLAPRRTFRAFVRGRASQNLYGESVEDLLGTSVADARRATGTDQPAPAAQLGDRVRFAGYVALGALVGTTLLAVACALLPLGLAAAAFAPRRAKTAEA
jgi:hypothetical protein